MFNNPFSSDVTIRQTYNGITKRYHANKAVRCLHSKQFLNIFSENRKEESACIINLHGNDPVHFEIMLKYLYNLKWKDPAQGTYDENPSFQIKFMVPIGVYALANKYDIEKLRTCATQQFPDREPAGYYSNDQYVQMIEAHYSQCIGKDCLMGRKIAALAVKSSKDFILHESFEEMVKKYPSLSVDIILQLFNNPTLSDIRIKQICKGKTREYYAHKAILCKESDYFMNAFTGSFQEASDSEMAIYDDDPEHFEFVLKFIYTEHYDKSAIEKISEGDVAKRTVIPIGIYAIADKYDITRLYSPAAEDVLTTFKSTPDDQHDVLRAAIQTHYEMSSRADMPMGNILASFVLEHRREFTKLEDFQILMQSFPTFAADIALALCREGVFKYSPLRCVCGWTIYYNRGAMGQNHIRRRQCEKCRKWVFYDVEGG
ncbi:hypothetical protein K505DRAFT_294799 [Melanomma pulvis-pyrius CBS 109.77]|uniref:BTB domain-containing protein n=1 Tax=Melanomma pulvis-pyrius CBS 109.77 TaxID=1314802 RepID=A0A6A6XTH1_9PLEO|nr:hypothetical protein K505DRAFT_294799 [Melanomma pulvis-pyrius CBS 109.77]